MAASGRSVPAAGSGEAEEPDGKIQVVEKAENAKARIKKKPFPWFGVILGLAVAGGLVYYFLILKTTLHVDSDPPGAKVYLDGKDSAKVTPCELKPSIGAHQIKVSLDGYADVEREVVVKNGKNSVLVPLDIGVYTLLSPSGNDNVQREAPCLVRWDSNALAASAAATASMRTMAVPRIDLELFRDDSKVSDIALGVPNTGTFTWDVPGTTAEGHNFKIQISCPGVIASRSFGPAFDLLGFKEDFTDNSADFWLADDAASWNAGGGYYSAGNTSKKTGLSVYDFLYPGPSYTVESKMRWSEFTGPNSEAPLFIMLGITNSRTVNSGYMVGYTIDGSIAVYSTVMISAIRRPNRRQSFTAAATRPSTRGSTVGTSSKSSAMVRTTPC
jgi:hypothetical protein